MRLDAMTFRETEDGPEPDTITVTMTARQAAWLLTLTGQTSDKASNEILPGFSYENTEIYRCLAQGVANPYFEDGADEMVRRVGER